MHKALDYNDGMFDPRNREIVSSEQHFDIEIKKDWAAYNYKTKDGNITGNLAIKGTIDLMTKVNDNTIEIIDWKTGRRLDWATGEEKTLSKLHRDAQLMIYFYATHHLYPDIEHIIISINFINDGGAYTICYDKTDLFKTEMMLKQKFETIKQSQLPALNKTWKCNKLCHFGKTTFENSHIAALTEYRDNQIIPKNSVMTKCEQVKHDIDIKGIDVVVDEYTSPGYTVSAYKAPGSIE